MPTRREQEVMQAGLDRHRDDTRMAELVVQEELSLERIAQEQQADKERLFAECHEAIGRIQAMQVTSEFGNVSAIMWLKDVKESKVYKMLPGGGTWEHFCNRLGFSAKLGDEKIANLKILGAQFLETVTNLRVGYRDLRKLRQLTADGAIRVDAEVVTIGDESIPLSPDHAEDLQLAIEAILSIKNGELAAQKRLVEQKQTTLDKRDAEIVVLEGKVEEAAAQVEAIRKHRSPDEEEFFRRMESWRIGFEALLRQFEPGETPLMQHATPRMEAAFIEVLGYFHRQITIWHACAKEQYGNHHVDDLGYVAPEPRGPALAVVE